VVVLLISAATTTATQVPRVTTARLGAIAIGLGNSFLLQLSLESLLANLLDGLGPLVLLVRFPFSLS